VSWRETFSRSIGETFHTRGERIFFPLGYNILSGGKEYSNQGGENILSPPRNSGGQKYHGTQALHDVPCLLY